MAKVFAYNATRLYREAYNVFAVNGILFNHESERRGETFVTRKITRGIARIKAGLDKKLYLGNLNAKRDWGYTIDRHYYRPAEVNYLVADAMKAKKILKWQPKTKFKDLVKIMVKADIDGLEK